MNKSIKSIIFAVVLGSLFTTTNISFANDHNSTLNGVLLAKGVENNFANFMNQNAKRFVKKENWGVFEQVVTLYNSTPSKLQTADYETKVAFNEAVKNIDKKLSKLNSNEAKGWRENLQVTARVINFLWNNKVSTEPIEYEMPETEVVAFVTVGK